MEERFQSFEEFWPFYVREHSNPLNRALHFVGTTAALGCLAGAAVGQWWLLPVAPVVGYGCAWIGHFVVEKNRPATFKYPLWSLRGDFVMWSKMLRGQMSEEVRRVLEQPSNGHSRHVKLDEARL
jgi:hypothetical protein